MGKDGEKEDSGFGFKDKAKAEETLKLLEAHDARYRSLTVRGLLGRAKRVLSLTKAEEKIKNIKEAMEVFENWLAEVEKEKQSKDPKKKDTKETPKKSESKEQSPERKEKSSDKKERSDKKDKEDSDVEMKEKREKSPPPDTVPGLGFKDKATAEKTLEILDGRDPEYQKLAVKGLIGRAKRVLTGTKDEGKVKSIKEAIDIFDKFLDEFDSLHLSRQNNAYLSLALVEGSQRLAATRGLKGEPGFLEAYRGARGEYKRLRTVAGEDGVTWDILRNKALKELKEKHKDAKLFDASGAPTDEHLALLAWGYSPEEARAKKLTFPEPEPAEERPDRKRRSSGEGAAGKRRRE